MAIQKITKLNFFDRNIKSQKFTEIYIFNIITTHKITKLN